MALLCITAWMQSFRSNKCQTKTNAGNNKLFHMNVDQFTFVVQQLNTANNSQNLTDK